MNISGEVQGKDTVTPAWTLPSTNYFTTTTEHLCIFTGTRSHKSTGYQGCDRFY